MKREGLLEKLLGGRKREKEELVIKELKLRKPIKLPNGDVIDREDILQVLSDGTIIYVAQDGSVKQYKAGREQLLVESPELNVSVI